MPFVTTLTLSSGDRRALDGVVDDIRERAQRKGVEINGPHPAPPTAIRVPQSKTLGPEGGSFEPWEYTVYERTIEIVGYESFARDLADREYPDAIHLEASIEQRTHAGS